MATERQADQTGFVCTVHPPVQRIVSLVPSQTELLFYLGLDQQCVGVTKFCIHPAKARTTRAVVGGTKTPDLELIRKLKPDLILGNKEENEAATIAALRREFPVWVSDISSLEDAYGMITGIGNLTETASRAAALVAEIRLAFGNMPDFNNQKVLYVIWRKPCMAAGPHTFIDSILQAAGFSNAVVQPRYPELTRLQLLQLRPDFVFLSSEPYPFSEKHIAEFQAALPEARVLLVDGEMFSWYGSRLLAVREYVQGLYSKLMPTDARSSQNEG